MTSNYNKTALAVEADLSRGMLHRDRFAHLFRWTHVVKLCARNKNMTIVDFGCGASELLQVLYTNRLAPPQYIGVDIRDKTIAKSREHWTPISQRAKYPFNVEFHAADLVKDPIATYDGDLVVSFEVIEHVGRAHAQPFLERFKAAGKPGAKYLLSTPIFNGKAAGNHTFDCGDGQGNVRQEFTFDELHAEILAAGFKIKDIFGTFASIRDYQDSLNEEARAILDRLRQYYSSETLAIILAPYIDPRLARNAVWELEA